MITAFSNAPREIKTRLENLENAMKRYPTSRHVRMSSIGLEVQVRCLTSHSVTVIDISATDRAGKSTRDVGARNHRQFCA